MEYENNRQTLQMTQRVLQIRNRPQRPAHEPLGLAYDDNAEGGDAGGAAAAAGAEERELRELQRMLTSGPCSKRPAPASRAAGAPSAGEDLGPEP